MIFKKNTGEKTLMGFSWNNKKVFIFCYHAKFINPLVVEKILQKICFFVFLSIVNGPILKKNCCQKSCVKVFVPIKNDFCVFMHCKFYCKVLQVFGPIKICSCCESFISEKSVESFNYLLEELDITVMATKESFDQNI